MYTTAIDRLRNKCLPLFAAVALGLFTNAQLASAAPVTLVTPGNLLPGSATASSSTHSGFPSSETVDQVLRNDPSQDNGLIFDDADTSERLSIKGFDSAINEIRIYSNTADTNRIPASVTIRSSTTSTNSLLATDYETLLQSTITPTFPLASSDPFGQITYQIFAVSAPANTKSLYFDFGGSGADRISEVQAFVPEPGTAMLNAIGSAVLFRRSSRKSGKCSETKNA